MTLNNEDSIVAIKSILESCGFSSDIESLDQDQIVRIVEIINRQLETIHKNTSPIYEKAMKTAEYAQGIYLALIQELADQYGEDIPSEEVISAFLLCKIIEQKGIEEMEYSLNELKQDKDGD